MSEQSQQDKPPVLGARRHKPACLCRMCVRIREMVAKGEENRRQGKPVRISGSTVKQQAFVQALTDVNRPDTFGNVSSAAVAAGYSPESGSYLLDKPQVQNLLLAAMRRVGITEKFLAERLREGLLAEEIRFFQHEGKVTDQRRVTDFHARAKFQDMVHRIIGAYPKEENVMQAALIIRLPERMSSEEWAARMGKKLPKGEKEAGNPESPAAPKGDKDNPTE